MARRAGLIPENWVADTRAPDPIRPYYDGSAQLTRAALVFFDQFATYDPPRGQGLPRVVADNAGPVSKG